MWLLEKVVEVMMGKVKGSRVCCVVVGVGGWRWWLSVVVGRSW